MEDKCARCLCWEDCRGKMMDGSFCKYFMTKLKIDK